MESKDESHGDTGLRNTEGLESPPNVEVMPQGQQLTLNDQSQALSTPSEDADIIQHSLVHSMMEKPAELLDLVLEHAVRSKRLSWRASRASNYFRTVSLESAISELFIWPENISPAQLQVLNQRVTAAFLKVAVIEIRAIPGDLTKALRGNEHNVSHLVLNLQIFNSHVQDELVDMFAFMDSWKTLYPRLKVCVISFAVWVEQDDGRRGYNVFDSDRLERWPFTKIPGVDTLGDLLRKVIDAFHARGPGDRKFIRFHTKYVDRAYTILYDPVRPTGPLVEVTSTAAIPTSERSSEVDESGTSAGSSVGEHVLNQAFQYCRSIRDW